MPLPMVHLSIAMKMKAQIYNRVDTDFLLGSIAPDAIHMRSGTNYLDKEKVHLETKLANDRVANKIRSFIEEGRKTGTDLHFIEGYAAHLITDRLWYVTIAKPIFDELGEERSWDEKRRLYYSDTDQIDLHLYDSVTWRDEVWMKLKSANAPDFPPHLTSSEIIRWRDRVLTWFDTSKDKSGAPLVRITDEKVEHFIESATKICLDILVKGDYDAI